MYRDLLFSSRSLSISSHTTADITKWYKMTQKNERIVRLPNQMTGNEQ